jgi:hypothetical protein
MNEDPIEERGGANLYAYARNEPLQWNDPLGTAICIFAVHNCFNVIPISSEGGAVPGQVPTQHPTSHLTTQPASQPTTQPTEDDRCSRQRHEDQQYCAEGHARCLAYVDAGCTIECVLEWHNRSLLDILTCKVICTGRGSTYCDRWRRDCIFAGLDRSLHCLAGLDLPPMPAQEWYIPFEIIAPRQHAGVASLFPREFNR